MSEHDDVAGRKGAAPGFDPGRADTGRDFDPAEVPDIGAIPGGLGAPASGVSAAPSGLAAGAARGAALPDPGAGLGANPGDRLRDGAGESDAV